MSQKKKKKHSMFDELFGDSVSDEAEFFKRLSTGYSVSVVQTPQGTKVKAKVGKDSDVEAVRRQLEDQYPNAEIEIEGGRKKPLIREISTKTLKQNKEDEPQ